jgi:predicted AAA+ superfamily ATPase
MKLTYYMKNNIKRFNESESENWRSDLTRKITKEDIINIIKSNTAEDAADEILEIMSIMTSTSGR